MTIGPAPMIMMEEMSVLLGIKKPLQFQHLRGGVGRSMRKFPAL